MRHLVTGGAGFIGSHLCEELLSLPDTTEVVCVDSFYTGREANIERLREDARFHVERHDVREPMTSISRWKVDRAWHLACPASPKAYQLDEVRTIEACVLGTKHALELAQAAGARLLLASTSEVYGDPAEHPQRESYRGSVSTTGPRACYDEGKRCAEALASAFARQRGVEVRVARIFNTYGPRMAPGDGRVVPNFIAQALAGEPLTVYGDGTQTRSLCYVGDLVDGLMLLMESEVAEPVNLGNPRELSVRELAELVHALVGKTGFKQLPLPIDDPRRRRPDVSRARELLGWEPKVALADGLRATIESFR